MGHGTFDRLKELGYGKVVKEIYFGETALQSNLYRNRRTEMYFLARDWLKEDVAIPEDETFVAELVAHPDYEDTSSGLHFLVLKDKIKEELGRSPNRADAFVLTFALPVKRRDIAFGASVRRTAASAPQQQFRTALKTLSRPRR
jgi:hypothetical protein